MKKIGIFGGSFDPIHHGHLILAREALETLGLDRILFVPAAQSPHKPGRVPASAAARWEMLNAAIANEDAFFASRLELDRPAPSYSVETVEQLHATMSDGQFSFLVGEDNLPQLQTWHRFADLERLVQFVVLDRSGVGVDYLYPAVRRKIDISATAIRKRVASGQSIRYLVPDAVERIIRRENLYQGTTESNPKN
ncbi:MAG: nicotinate (nicotinamide) nucleotide adenylyltransferase [Chthoniobacterales bacterium]|nr:nicotinate (nicotinamide) nucleotide adenylyltransferase [Chthoniobacterales bacterium]